jgi:hypothetical protein
MNILFLLGLRGLCSSTIGKIKCAKGRWKMSSPMIYELRRPKQVDPDKTYPALFIMHGIGSNEQNMLSLIDGLEDHFYIFSIRGSLQQPPGYAFFRIGGYGKPHREEFEVLVILPALLIM